jgi:hypothetical protein
VHDCPGFRGGRELPGPAQLERALAGFVNLFDLFVGRDQLPAGRKIRTFDGASQLARGQLLAFDQRVEQANRRVRDFFGVVRRNVRGHADRDARRAVDEQVRHRRRQHHGLELGTVVIGPKMNGILFDLLQQLVGERRQTALGVAHGRRCIAVQRAEVARTVDHQRAQAEGLCHTHQRVVDRGVAVRVVVTHHVTDDLGALAMLAVGAQTLLPHRVEDAALHRLQAVPDVRQGAAGDDRQRIVEVAGLGDLVEGRGLFAPRLDFLATSSAPPTSTLLRWLTT